MRHKSLNSLTRQHMKPCSNKLTAILFVGTIPAILNSIAAMRNWNALWWIAAFELQVHARVRFAFDFVGSVQTLDDPVAYLRRSDAVKARRGVVTLEKSRLATVVWRTGRRFIRVVTTIVLFVTFPPERNALVRLGANKFWTEMKTLQLELGLHHGPKLKI